MICKPPSSVYMYSSGCTSRSYSWVNSQKNGYKFSVLSRFTNVCMPCLPRSLRIHFFCKPLFNYLDHCNDLNWFCLNIFVLILFILLKQFKWSQQFSTDPVCKLNKNANSPAKFLFETTSSWAVRLRAEKKNSLVWTMFLNPLFSWVRFKTFSLSLNELIVRLYYLDRLGF